MTKNKILLPVIVFWSLCCFAQKTIKGTILNLESNFPVDYVNVGVVDRQFGTISDKDGFFELLLEGLIFNHTDIIRFSRVGYKSLEFTLFDLREKFKNGTTLFMEEMPFELSEIIINNETLVHDKKYNYLRARKLSVKVLV